MFASQRPPPISAWRNRRSSFALLSFFPSLEQILRKGKIVHPNAKLPSRGVSDLLLRTSADDVTSGSKKPSLMVMGVPNGFELRNPNANKNDGNQKGGLVFILLRFLSGSFRIGRGIFVGVFVFFRSLLLLPTPARRDDDRND